MPAKIMKPINELKEFAKVILLAIVLTPLVLLLGSYALSYLLGWGGLISGN